MTATLTVVLSCTRGTITDTRNLILPLTREHMETYAAAILSGVPVDGWTCVALHARTT
jgi:hypothetical protein